MLDSDQGVPALQKNLHDIIAEYTEKCVGAEAEVAAYKAKLDHMDTISTVAGTFVHPGLDLENYLRPQAILDRLLRSAWRHVYNGLNVKEVATAKDRKSIDLMLTNPPPFTIENIREYFGDYLLDPRYHVLRGLAEAFTELDPAFKSHNKVKIGVSGLPKRIVITSAFSQDSWGGWGSQGGTVRDVMNALQVYRGEPRLTHNQLDAMEKEAKRCGESDWPGGRIKRFKNGNAHLFFDKDGMADANRGLAEFYGEVLPDSPEADAERPKRRPCTEVSADLAYFWTSPAVIEAMIDAMPIRGGDTILEPSCGDGRIMDGIVDHVRANRIADVRLTGIEYDAGRVEEAQRKGHSVLRANFLNCGGNPAFDLIFMNPPFAGRHYLKHIAQAIKMLKPGGRLISVLPAPAWFDHEGLPGRKYNPDCPYDGRDTWTDLPLGSFRAAGTNVCTGLWRYHKPTEATT